MYEIPTYGLALKVWWAFLWRAVLLSLLGGLGAGIVVGLVGAAVGADKQTIESLGGIAGGAMGVLFSVVVLYRLMTKGFRGYRLAVTKK